MLGAQQIGAESGCSDSGFQLPILFSIRVEAGNSLRTQCNSEFFEIRIGYSRIVAYISVRKSRSRGTYLNTRIDKSLKMIGSRLIT